MLRKSFLDGHRHVAVYLLLFDEAEVGRVGDVEAFHAFVDALEIVLDVVATAV
jgi:hypothetical protein